MGTKVQIDNYLPGGHCSMRDLSRESNGLSWPSCCDDNSLTNGHFYYGFISRTIASSHPDHDKDVLKQKMLEHEATFKDQVYELHRLYQVQRDLMDEVRRKEQFKHRILYETSSSSSPVPSQMHYDDMHRWNGHSLPVVNLVGGRSPFAASSTKSFPHSTNGESHVAGPSPLKNCSSPRDSEVSESRPTKCRRRMLDLRLPADEYMDPDEVDQFDDAKVSDNISPEKSSKFASGNELLNYPGKKQCHRDASKSESHVNSRLLADLNEPLNVEETTADDFVNGTTSHRDVWGRDVSAKNLTGNSKRGCLNGDLNDLPLENGANGQDWFSYRLKSEQQHEGSSRSINKETPSVPYQPIQSLHDQAVLTRDRLKVDPWRSKSGGTVEHSDRSYFLPNYNMPEPISMSSHVPNNSSLFPPSNLGKAQDQNAMSQGKSSGCLSQKLSAQSSPFLCSSTLNKTPPLSSQNNNLFGNKWNLNSSADANLAFPNEPSVGNGFFQGFSMSFKEQPCSSNSYFKTATCMDMNLNTPLPDGVFNDHVSQPDLKIRANNHESNYPRAVLPWLGGKGLCSNEAESSRKSLYNGDVKVKIPDSNDCMNSRKTLGVPIFEKSLTPEKENITIISSLNIQHLSEKDGVGSLRKADFDINLPCDPSDSDIDNVDVEVVVIEKKLQSKSTSVINQFDLNSCITEEESLHETSLPDNNANIKRGTGIDLEAPITLESEDEDLREENPLMNRVEKQVDLLPATAEDQETEICKAAAEAIVAINQAALEEEADSHPLEASEEELLCWFVDIACSSGNEVENQLVIQERNGNGNGLPLEGLDEFESMTLRLKVCVEEEYFPEPSIPEYSNMEENSKCVLTSRTRKGQARRGRQRRDFQRDILPGLASLSRHEVTEDLQTFGGLMRATGHPWQSGLKRRNASRGRGRRRSVVAAVTPPEPVNTPSCEPLKSQHGSSSNNSETVLEDRSLTGWGKTTRRPRRQRYPAGNPPRPVPSN